MSYTLASWLINGVGFIHGLKDAWSQWPMAVASMSQFYAFYQPADPYTGATATTLDTAVDAIVSMTNVPFFTSANNFSANACMFSPAHRAYTNNNHSGTVMSVGGTSMSYGVDSPWQEAGVIGDWNKSPQGSGSNAGDCVSIYAPAKSIYVAWPVSGSTTTYSYRDGTSFGAPLAAAAAARYIQKYRNTYGITPSYTAVYDFLLTSATPINVDQPTTEYWMCQQRGSDALHSYLTDLGGACPSEYPDDETVLGTAPIHFPSVHNSSNAGMLYTGTIWP